MTRRNVFLHPDKVALFAVTVLSALILWASPSEAGTSAQPPLERSALFVETQDGDLHRFVVELADDRESRRRGLMFRENLGPDEGMLFDFERERPVSMWMKNTLIPLDMVFIRASGRIAGIHSEAEPGSLASIRSPEPVRYVLEIPGGRAAELSIEAGDHVRHPRIASAASAP